MRANEFLNENNNIITVYHGDNYGTSKLQPSLMNNGTNQEGIGIYFSNSIETAQSYGKYIIKTTINLNKFINSRKQVSKLGLNNIKPLLHFLWEHNPEDMFYYISDWMEVIEPSDVTAEHINILSSKLLSDEIRNFQITLAQTFGVEIFVHAWNKFIKFDGTYIDHVNSELWFAIINTSIPVYPI